jgi:hypothetical protein
MIFHLSTTKYDHAFVTTTHKASEFSEVGGVGTISYLVAATLLARHSWAAAAAAAALLGVQEFEEFFYHWQFLQWSMGYGKFLGLLKLRRAFLPKLARSELLFS